MPSLYCRNIKGLPFTNIPNAALNHKFYNDDIVCLQEAFRFGANARRLSWGFSNWRQCFPNRNWFGSGLMTAAKQSWGQWLCKAYPRPGLRAGWSKHDWLVPKGFFGIRWNDIWVVHTHMNAGGEEADWKQREIEAKMLCDHFPAQGPMIVCGDFNLDAFDPFQRPRVDADNVILDTILDRGGLQVDCWNNVDGILSRGIPGILARPQPEDNLSDHLALRAEW